MSNVDKCVGNSALSFDAWTQTWNDDFCFNTFNDIIYTTDGSRTFNPQALISVQTNWTNIFNNYIIKWGKNIGSTGDPGYNSFQNTLQATCSRLPGACDLALQNSICNGYTREQIANNLGLLELCGCFAPPEEGTPCASVTSSAARRLCASSTSSFKDCIPQCDPLCTQSGVVRLSDGVGGSCTCQTDVCVINNVSIKATDTTVGSTNFNQVCGACASNGCTCIISGVSISSLGDSVGLTSANFNQQCNTSSRCFVSSSDSSLANSNQVDCSKALNNNIQDPESFEPGSVAGLPLGFWIAVIIILFIVAGLIFYTNVMA